MKLRKSAIKELSESTGVDISKKADVEQKNDMIFVDKVPFFFFHDNKRIPTLHCLKNNNVLPSITIDAGAVKFLIKGADMMRPGITAFENFVEGDSIAVRGPSSDIPIGVGIALMDSNTAEKESSGKVMKTIHYTGDSIWNTTLH